MTNQNIPDECSFECFFDSCCSTDCHPHVWYRTLNTVINQSFFLVIDIIFLFFLFSPSAVHWSLFFTEVFLVLHVIIGYIGLMKPSLGLLLVYFWDNIILFFGMTLITILDLCGIIDFHQYDDFSIWDFFYYIIKGELILICIAGACFSKKLSTDPFFLHKCGVTLDMEEQYLSQNVDNDGDNNYNDDIYNDYNRNIRNNNLLSYNQEYHNEFKMRQIALEKRYMGEQLPVHHQYTYYYPIQVESSNGFPFSNSQIDRNNGMPRIHDVPFQDVPPSPLYQGFHPPEYIGIPQFSYIPIPNQNINQQNTEQSQGIQDQSPDNFIVPNDQN